MVYRETSAQDVTSQRATLSPFSTATLLSLDRITGGKALSPLHPVPLSRPLSPARRTRLSRLHYLRTPYVMPLKQPALTLSRLMRLVSPLVFETVDWRLLGEILGGKREPNRNKGLGIGREIFWNVLTVFIHV